MTDGCCVSMAAHSASCSGKFKPLPGEPWVHAEWRRCRVGLDYHVELERHYYSVPYRFARREVEARTCARTVEIFLGGERIAAAHMRAVATGGTRRSTPTCALPRLNCYRMLSRCLT